MSKEILSITKKGFCLTLLVLVSFVMSLPRAQESLSSRVSSMSWTGHFSHGLDGLDMRLLKVRKFRRRRTNFTFNTHLSVAFLSDPSAQLMGRYLAVDDLILSRDPDPLVHPPA